jgi:tRNA (guanine37-N1)-methyltransferase
MCPGRPRFSEKAEVENRDDSRHYVSIIETLGESARRDRLLRPSVRVRLTSAESALKLLTELRLVDRDYDFKKVNGSVLIPLLRDLVDSEFDKLNRKIPEVMLEESEFEPKEKKPRNLVEALAGKIPSDILAELPRSFDIIGDLAILELRPPIVHFEESIALALLETQSNVKGVFAKTGPITGHERVRPLRYLAGEDRTVTVHQEFGCSFKVDLAGVFFSPRLSTEHQRVAGQVVLGETVVDMFAGVGPFSILIAKTVRDVKVEAIDSNPVAARFAEENALTNRVESKIGVHLGDAREVAGELGHIATRVIMNHPSAAREFVGEACDLLLPSGGVVHYYTFAERNDSDLLARSELADAVASSGHKMGKIVGVRKVREVAPMNWQVAVDAEIT